MDINNKILCNILFIGRDNLKKKLMEVEDAISL